MLTANVCGIEREKPELKKRSNHKNEVQLQLSQNDPIRSGFVSIRFSSSFLILFIGSFIYSVFIITLSVRNQNVHGIEIRKYHKFGI